MNETSDTIPEGNAENEKLVAYLDGELDSESRHQLEERLSGDHQLRQRLKEYQQAWDLLDELPRERVDDSFAKTTVEMVAIRAEELLVDRTRKASRHRWGAWGAALVCSILAALAGYWVTQQYVSAPNRQLVDDLPILEHLDAYQSAGSVEFLRQLEQERLFVEDGDAAR